MSDLVSRLLAAIEETEQLAQEAAIDGIDTWKPEDPAFWWSEDYPMSRAERDHVARNDPAAVLRRCAADRNTIGMCQAAMKQYERGESDTSGYTLAMMVLVHLHEAYGISVEEETPG